MAMNNAALAGLRAVAAYLRQLFVGPADLGREERKRLLLLGAAFVIAQYEMTLLTLSLPDIQASFDIAEQDIGKVIALSRLGALPALLLALLADRVGRLRLLIASLLGMSVCALASGLAQTAGQFMLCQFFARMFAAVQDVVAVIYALESLPPRRRGWGVGVLAAMGGAGSGFASILYSLVESLPGGWRALYMLGGGAVFYVLWLRRQLPESPLFQQHTTGSPRSGFWRPLQEIITHHRRALAAIVVISVAFGFQVTPALNFMSKYLQASHGYSPGQVGLLFIAAGTFAIVGNLMAGQVSDRIGRRPTLAIALLMNCGAFLAFYNSAGLWLPLAWIAALFSFFAVDVVLNAISGELFPTSCRSTASTLRAICSVLAMAAGLVVEGTLYTLLGSHGAALSLMTLSSLLALPAIAWLLPESAHRSLQATADAHP